MFTLPPCANTVHEAPPAVCCDMFFLEKTCLTKNQSIGWNTNYFSWTKFHQVEPISNKYTQVQQHVAEINQPAVAKCGYWTTGATTVGKAASRVEGTEKKSWFEVSNMKGLKATSYTLKPWKTIVFQWENRGCTSQISRIPDDSKHLDMTAEQVEAEQKAPGYAGAKVVERRSAPTNKKMVILPF